jgi:streptogramin lyase
MNFKKYSFFFFLIFTVTISCKKEEVSFSYPKKNIKVRGTNGITEHQGNLWVADLLGSQIIGFDREGKIFATYTPNILGSAPDDLCFVDDTTIVWTSFFTGEVKMTTLRGKTTVLATGIPSVNPIAKVPNERSVIVSSSVGDDVSLYKIDIDNPSKVVIKTGIQGINGFEVDEFNNLYAPIFNLESIVGNGQIFWINLVTKFSLEFVPDFINEPNKQGYNGPTGVAYGGQGIWYVLESVGGINVYKLIPSLNESERIFSSNIPIGDNLCVAEDGNIYVTTFLEDSIIEITPEGNSRVFRLRN